MLSRKEWKWIQQLRADLIVLEGDHRNITDNLLTLSKLVFSSAISGFTNMSPEDYRNVFWSQLKDAIDQMLTHPPGSYKPISYEQVRPVLLSLSSTTDLSI